MSPIEHRTTQGTAYVELLDVARGGFGHVRVAVLHEDLLRCDGPPRYFAIKRPIDSYQHDPSFRSMFLEEARIAGLIRHENVVSVVDLGEDQRGPFLVMDYIEGINASELIQRSQGPLPIQIALLVTAHAARGLRAAHELHDGSRSLAVVHRDVAPNNILIGTDGQARVADFGIAKAGGQVTDTTTGVLKGKLGYMAPERLRFVPPDARSDLFSLGVVFFELLAGRRLYREERDERPAALRILEDPIPDIGEERPEVPAEVSELLFELLQKDPAVRVRRAAEVAERLENILSRLREEQGPADLAAFVANRFSSQLAERRERLRVELSRVRKSGPRERTGSIRIVMDGDDVPRGTKEEASFASSSHPPAPSTSGERVRPWLRASFFTFLGGALVAGAWAGVASQERPSPADDRDREQAGTAEAAPRPVPRRQLPRTVRVPAEPAAEESTGVEAGIIAPPAVDQHGQHAEGSPTSASKSQVADEGHMGESVAAREPTIERRERALRRAAARNRRAAERARRTRSTSPPDKSDENERRRLWGW